VCGVKQGESVERLWALPVWARSEALSCALAGLGRIDQGFDDPIKTQGVDAYIVKSEVKSKGIFFFHL
jgi:hypothetical protein